MNEAISRYFQLVEERPEWFCNNGGINIELDVAVIEAYISETGRQLGVVYESDYNIMLVDLVYQQPGVYGCYERVIKKSTGPGIVVVPKYKEKYVLLRQYRHALRREQYAFPRGFGEDGLSGEENTRKEVKEEIGSDVIGIHYLGNVIADSGMCGNSVEIYYADVTEPVTGMHDEGIMDICYVTDNEIKEMIKNGEIDDGFTISAYMYLSANLCIN